MIKANGCRTTMVAIQGGIDFTDYAVNIFIIINYKENMNMRIVLCEYGGMEKAACERRFEKSMKEQCATKSISERKSCSGNADIYILGANQGKII